MAGLEAFCARPPVLVCVSAAPVSESRRESRTLTAWSKGFPPGPSRGAKGRGSGRNRMPFSKSTKARVFEVSTVPSTLLSWAPCTAEPPDSS